ncbi:hypothetical protein ABBQ38_003332 [Trebouxia sp. C0009 RCD-2024]
MSEVQFLTLQYSERPLLAVHVKYWVSLCLTQKLKEYSGRDSTKEEQTCEARHAGQGALVASWLIGAGGRAGARGSGSSRAFEDAPRIAACATQPGHTQLHAKQAAYSHFKTRMAATPAVAKHSYLKGRLNTHRALPE